MILRDCGFLVKFEKATFRWLFNLQCNYRALSNYGKNHCRCALWSLHKTIPTQNGEEGASGICAQNLEDISVSFFLTVAFGSRSARISTKTLKNRFTLIMACC